MDPRFKLTLPGALAIAALIAIVVLVRYRPAEPASTPAPELPAPTAERPVAPSKQERAQTGSERRQAPQESDEPPLAGPTLPADTDGRTDAPGDFSYYALVLSWSPTHCGTAEGRDDESQCARADGRRYGFVLHGLWPQYDRGYPESCATRSQPYVPQSVIDDMMDIMPSKRLIIHEYRKHGTCSGLSPDAYFRAARRMFESIAIPDRFKAPTDNQSLYPSEVVDAFVARNSRLKPEMLAIDCGGRWPRLKDVMICFSKTGEPKACGANEDQGALCRDGRITVPPVQ
jgi:ribonuclease T2